MVDGGGQLLVMAEGLDQKTRPLRLRVRATQTVMVMLRAR
jgi:hypothetical protein